MDNANTPINQSQSQEPNLPPQTQPPVDPSPQPQVPMEPITQTQVLNPTTQSLPTQNIANSFSTVPVTQQTTSDPALVIGPQQPFVSNAQQATPKPKKSKLVLLILVIAVLLICAGGAYALFGRKTTSYQDVIKQFVTAIQNKDKATVDSLESPAAKVLLQKNTGNASFYDTCQKEGILCTADFSMSVLAKGTQTVKGYTAADGTKGKAVTYTIKQSLNGAQAGGQGCSSNGTTTLTFDVVPKGSSWLIDNLDEGNNFSANLCPAPGASSSVGN